MRHIPAIDLQGCALRRPLRGMRFVGFHSRVLIPWCMTYQSPAQKGGSTASSQASAMPSIRYGRLENYSPYGDIRESHEFDGVAVLTRSNFKLRHYSPRTCACRPRQVYNLLARYRVDRRVTSLPPRALARTRKKRLHKGIAVRVKPRSRGLETSTGHSAVDAGRNPQIAGTSAVRRRLDLLRHAAVPTRRGSG